VTRGSGLAHLEPNDHSTNMVGGLFIHLLFDVRSQILLLYDLDKLYDSIGNKRRRSSQ
jgi:hypothetical protein